MDKVLEPQILFLYNETGKVYKTLFLFFGDEEELEKKKLFELFLYFKKQFDIFVSDEYELISDHLLLTLSLYELRGYIQTQILKTDEPLLIFSIWDNVDFSNVDGSVFNPFKTSHYTRTPDQTIIYDVFPRVVSNAIFCVLESRFAPNKKLCSMGLTQNDSIVKFIQGLKEIDLGDKEIEIEIEENSREMFQIDLTDEFEMKIQTLSNYKRLINKYYFDSISITGDRLYYKEQADLGGKKKDLSYILVYDQSYQNKVFSVMNNMLTIENHLLFDKILVTSELRKNLLKQKKNKYHSKLIYNLSFTDNVYIDFEISFFLETTKKTKNIFLDRTKKINIITSSNHILFSSFSTNYDLYIYLTKMIIFIQLQNGAVSFFKQDKKLGNRYFSRYCQGERNPKMITGDSFNTSDYVNYNNLFYKSIHNEGDIFYSDEKKSYVVCDTPGLYHIGFIAEIYEGYNICFPCCYKKIKQNTDIFKTCIGEGVKENESVAIDPYIHIFKQYRIIMNKNKIGFLIDRLNDIFNLNRSSYLQDRYKIKKVSSKQLSMRLKALNEMNIKQYKNSNLFFNLNDQVNDVCVYTNGKKSNCYSFERNEFAPLKKEIISFQVKKQTFTKFNDIYDQISVLDSFIVINSQNRIELAKNYIVYYINQKEKDFPGLNHIYQNNDLIFYIIDDAVYFNPSILEFYYRDADKFLNEARFFLVIQNKIHTFKSISKLSYYSNIEMTDLDVKQKRLLLDRLINVEPIIFSEKNKSYDINYQRIQIEDENFFFFDQTKTKYMYNMDNISLNKDSIGFHITNVLYKKYFSLFYQRDELDLNEQKKVFLSNLKNFMNIDIEFNRFYKPVQDQELINKVKSYLNPLYL